MKMAEVPKANPENLLSIIRDVYSCKVVLPEFQRSFIWGRENIEELLVSVLQGYFIGTFLILDTQPDGSLFPLRQVEGLETVNPDARLAQHPTVRLVLDGQQRITSLFYALYQPSIPLYRTGYAYRFFFRLDLALDEDPTDAVMGISLADRRRLSELETLTAEHKAVPFTLFLDSSRFYPWLFQEQRFLTGERERKLIETYYRRFADFMVPVVSLSPETGRENIVSIFERINRTGVNLSLFDLATARLYLKDIKLRELWRGFKKANQTLADIIRPEFLLKLIALFQGRETRKGSLLDVIDALNPKEFVYQWDRASYFLRQAYKRATASGQTGYGAIVPKKWLPYTTMLVPLAALLHHVDDRRGGEHLYRKVDQWYWANVFAQRYDQGVDTKTYQDLRDMCAWFDGGDCPAWLRNLSTDGFEIDTDESRSAVYRGIMCQYVLAGAKDFLDGNAADLHACQDDHIFPRARFAGSPHVNSILNRTLISTRTNEVKADRRPSEYLPILLEHHGGDNDKLRATLQSHLIDTEAECAMWRDDINGFVEARKRALVQVVRDRLAGKA